LPEQDRLPVARHYIELHEKLLEFKDLELAVEFGKQWAVQITAVAG
jgi:hypothetical protein